jgi:type IV pilus assembly protein PilY1
LLSKTISYNSGSRVISTTNPNWTSQYGWYLDFTDTDGERVTTKALLIQDKLIFPTLIPSSISCEYGGKSWLMEVPAVGDKFKGLHLLEKIEKSDFLILGDLGFGMVHGGIPPAKTSSSSSSSSSSASADKCSGSAQGAVLASTSKATLLNESACLNPGDYARQSWRQLR